MGYQYVSALGDRVNEATHAFQKTNGGESPSSASQLLPYFTAPIDETQLKQYWETLQL